MDNAFDIGELLAAADDIEKEEVPRTPAPSKIFKRAELTHELDIRPIASAAKLQDIDKHENLLRPPFLYIINGGVRSGKSCLITNMVYRKEFYRGVFDKIILVSPTAHADPTFAAFNEDPHCEVHAPSSPEDLNASIDHVVETIAPDGVPTGDKVLLVIDDCASFIRNSDSLCKIATKYRHYGLSMIISAQYYLRLPPVIRVNATAIVIFRIANSKEKKTIFDEQASTFGDMLPKAYDEVFKEGVKFQFIILNLRERSILEGFKRVIAKY